MEIFLIIFLIIAFSINILILVAKKKTAAFLRKYFGTTDLKKAIELSEIENQNTPKSLSGMETVALPLIEKDFPELNIDELKRQSESSIISYLEMLEKKEYTELSYSSEKVKQLILSHINDLNDNDKIVYSSINIHRTIVNQYKKNNGIATISFRTSLEYICKKNEEASKKVQDRFETEFIYIIDTTKISDSSKNIGLNCPNCGAPIRNLGSKTCEYCGSGTVDIVKRTWYLNSIKRF